MHSTAEGGSDETSTEIHAINPSDLSLTRDPRMERESFGFPLGFTPRHYWQRMPGWEQVSRTLTRDYTFDINRTSNSESTHNLRLRVAPPGSAPAVSPRLRRRQFTVASGPRQSRPCPEFPARRSGWVRTAIQPSSTGLELAVVSRGVTRPVPLVYLPVSLTAPGPSGSPRPTRLRRGCSHPPRRSPAQAASSFIPLLRQQEDEGLPPPSGQTAPRGAPTPTTRSPGTRAA